MANLQHFVHDKLSNSPETLSPEIRLLKVHYGGYDGELEFWLETYRYSECPEYYALSYTWGLGNRSHLIIINDQRFKVQQNLFNFLKWFRSPHRSELLLWVDQICINQDDVPERSSQVRCMGQYYSRASQVLVWLGIGTDLELAALADIRQPDITDTSSTKRKVPMSLDLVRGYCSIITNPYFERLWVVQEMARARDIVIIMGKENCQAETTSWRQFNFAFLKVMLEVNVTSTTARTAQEEMMLRLEIRDRRILLQLLEVKKRQKSLDIFELIEAFHEFKCADLRDKLFALQDIGDLKQQLFTIDYSRDTIQVYGEFAATCMKLADSDATFGSRNFDILARLGRAMEVQFQLVSHPKTDKGFVPTASVDEHLSDHAITRHSTIRMLEDSTEYVNEFNVRVFGPRYDKETGDHVSPLSHEQTGDTIPRILRFPASVDRREMQRIAATDLAKRLNQSPEESGLIGADGESEVDSIEDVDPDGYRTVMVMLGKTDHWRLPRLETDP